MKKSLIALAVASVFIAPVALAQTAPGGADHMVGAAGVSKIIVYGLASVSFDLHDSGAATLNKTTRVSSNSSRLGFKSSEDLGGGLSAFWQIETGLNLDAPVGTVLGSRDAFAGLKSNSIGSVVLGSGGTPYRGSTRGLDLFQATQGENFAHMGNRVLSVTPAAPGDLPAALIAAGIGTNSRLDGGGTNVLAYVSPTMGGVNVTVAKGFDENAATSADASFITVKYNAGPIYATVARGTFNHSATSDTTGTKVGGSYTMDAFAVNVVLENIVFTNGANETKYTNMYLGGKYNISQTDAVMLGITKAGDTELNGASSTNGYRHTTAGYYHKMSKDTMLYALINKNDGPDSSIVSLGMHKAF